MSEFSSGDDPEPGNSSRFSIAGFLLLMFIGCVMATAGYYVVRGISAQDLEFAGLTTGDASSSGRFVFILFTLSAPILLMIVFSLVAGVIMWIRGR